jgi:hypothetical protein
MLYTYFNPRRDFEMMQALAAAVVHLAPSYVHTNDPISAAWLPSLTLACR